MAAWQASYDIEIAAPWPVEYARTLDRVARRERTLIAGVRTWGREDGNRLDVYLEAGVPESAYLRLDLREWDTAFVDDITTCLAAWDSRIVAPDGHTLRPDAASLMQIAAASPAARFMEDPDSYLRRVRLGDYSDG